MSEAEFLRAYWCDGAFAPAHPGYGGQKQFFDGIASTPGIQVRLGHLTPRPSRWQHAVKRAVQACGVTLDEFARHFTFRDELQQKGVDTLIVLDLVRLAERRAYAVAVLIAGDRDIAEAVRVAQDAGRRVIVARPAGVRISTELRHLADALIDIDNDALHKMITRRPPRSGEPDLDEDED